VAGRIGELALPCNPKWATCGDPLTIKGGNLNSQMRFHKPTMKSRLAGLGWRRPPRRRGLSLSTAETGQAGNGAALRWAAKRLRGRGIEEACGILGLGWCPL